MPNIEPADAKHHLGKTCVVTLFVRSVGNSKLGGLKYLNSEANFNLPTNLAVLLEPEAQTKLADAGVKDPLEEYYRKWVRVTGRVQRHKGRMQIKLESPRQIEALDLPPPTPGPSRPEPTSANAPPAPAAPEEAPPASFPWLPAGLIGASCFALGFVAGRFMMPAAGRTQQSLGQPEKLATAAKEG